MFGNSTFESLVRSSDKPTERYSTNTDPVGRFNHTTKHGIGCFEIAENLLQNILQFICIHTTQFNGFIDGIFFCSGYNILSYTLKQLWKSLSGLLLTCLIDQQSYRIVRKSSILGTPNTESRKLDFKFITKIQTVLPGDRRSMWVAMLCNADKSFYIEDMSQSIYWLVE